MSQSSLERHWQFYPNMRYHKILMGWCRSQLYKKAEGANNIIENFFKENFTEAQLEKFIAIYEKMTAEERRHPGRLDDRE